MDALKMGSEGDGFLKKLTAGELLIIPGNFAYCTLNPDAVKPCQGCKWPLKGNSVNVGVAKGLLEKYVAEHTSAASITKVLDFLAKADELEES